MKHIILFFGLFLFGQSIGATVITPSSDTIPYKKWSFGAQVSDLNLGSYVSTYGFGVFGERRISKNFGIESELAYINHRLSANATRINSKSLRLSISGKVYFGENKRWFGKFGLQSEYVLDQEYFNYRNFDNPFNPIKIPYNSFKDRLFNSMVFGIGYEVPLKNGGGIKLEFNNTVGHTVSSSYTNFKVGYRF